MSRFTAFFLLSFTHLSGSFAADWISHKVNVPDTRFLPATISQLEVMELPYDGAEPPEAVMLMLSGFFQNSSLFDLMPARDISLARYFMAKFKIKIYVIHVRGIGRSDKVKWVSIDDYAVDDLPAALNWVSKKEKRKLITFGHSQGGMIMKASLAGLSRCGLKGNCFLPKTAEERQSVIEAVAASGANVRLSAVNPDSSLKVLGKRMKPIVNPVRLSMDEIKVFDLLQKPLFGGLAYLHYWELLYHRENVDREAMKALYTKTIDGTSSTVLAQLIEGINGSGLRTTNPKKNGERYSEHLKNIKRPYANVTYELDQISEPEASYRDDFTQVGSHRKRFFVAPGLGHEDFMMKRSLHSTWDEALVWILRVRRSSTN